MQGQPEKRKILLVEDEVIIALQQKMILEKNGFSVITANCGEKAIHAVESDLDVDLILMDIDLGTGIDGTEAAARIVEHNDLPVVFLSSHTEPEIVDKTERITSYGYIVKNSGETVLIASIKMAFRLHEAQIELKNQRSNLNSALAHEERTTEKLLEKTEELEQYFRSSLDLLGILDPDGKLLRLNAEWEKTLGYSLGELENTSLTDLVVPDDRHTMLEGLSRTVDRNEVSRYETRCRCKDGSVRWIEWRGKLIGPTLCFAGRDITEQKRAKIAEENSRNVLDLIFDSVPAMIWRKDLDGRIVRVNKTGCNFLCLRTEQILGKTAWDLFPPELAAQLERDDEAVIQARGPVYGVVRQYRRPSGELSVLRIDKVPFTDADGTLRGTIGFVVDITAESMSEEEAKDNERFLRSIIDNSHDMIEVLDTNGNYTFVGRARTLAGYDSEDLIGMNAFEHIKPDQRAQAEKLFDKLISTGDPQTMEVTHRKPDGSWMWLETTGRRIEYRGETRVLLNTRDITERKTAERVVAESRREKETRSREAHHRVKNNLTAVYCMLARKSDSLVDGDAKNALGDAQRCVQAIALLYDRLSRTDRSERLSIRDYLRPLVDEIIAAVPSAVRITSRTEIEDIVVDVNRLSTLGLLTNEIVTNAMQHAFRAMTEGVIWVSANRCNDQVILTIRDNGIGLPPSLDIDRPTGLGLTLVRALVEQIDGRMAVDRTSGTRFEITFPLEKTATNSTPTVSSSAACSRNRTS